MCLAKRIPRRKVGVITGQDDGLPVIAPGDPLPMNVISRPSGYAAPALLW